MSITQSPVVELRQYTLRPGARDTLVAIFEAEFVESQEELGIAVGGIFEDRDDPDRFVWMRGFASMEARKDALTAFYFGGEAWKRHGPAANATMVDSDDVLLLRPTDPPVLSRPAADDSVVATVWLHAHGAGTCDWLTRMVHPRLERALGTTVAAWRTEPAENTFPALPVRPDHAFVSLATVADEPAYAAALAGFEDELRDRGVTTQTLRLRPTPRSQHA
jgi:hypothetical protein